MTAPPPRPLFEDDAYTVSVEAINGRHFVVLRDRRFGGRVRVPIDRAASIGGAFDRAITFVFDAEAKRRSGT